MFAAAARLASGSKRRLAPHSDGEGLWRLGGLRQASSLPGWPAMLPVRVGPKSRGLRGEDSEVGAGLGEDGPTTVRDGAAWASATVLASLGGVREAAGAACVRALMRRAAGRWMMASVPFLSSDFSSREP